MASESKNDAERRDLLPYSLEKEGLSGFPVFAQIIGYRFTLIAQTLRDRGIEVLRPSKALRFRILHCGIERVRQAADARRLTKASCDHLWRCVVQEV